MPELDGFGVVEALGPRVPPAMVFVTAYDRYALKAFEVHALDYLLKPFDRDRLRAALARARQVVRRRDTEDLERRLGGLLQDLRGAGRAPDRLAVKHEGRITFVRIDDIDWVEAADNYVQLHVGNERHALRETMNALEARLSGRRFLRINRSTIVNIDRIRELQPLFHGEYAVILRNGTRLTLSRGYRDKLDLLLGKGE
jgi:two-component system LytT family response regulator